MKNELHTRTHTDLDPPPMVIHHAEDDQTLLARWLQRAMSKGPTFWMLLAGTVAAIFAVGYLISGLTSGQSATSRAWEQVILAGSLEDFQRVAETEGDTPAGRWAALTAASNRYREAVGKLPGDRESAAPVLKQALEGYQALESDSKADDVLRRLAAIGVARTLESSDELPEAITAYEKVARNWPDTDEGKAAAKRAERLKTTEAIAFYKKFNSYKPRPASTTLPPRGTNRLDLPGMPAGHPDPFGPMMPAPPLTGGVPAGSVPSPGSLPFDPFQKSGAERKASSPQPKDDTLPDVYPKDEAKPGAAAPSGSPLPFAKDPVGEKPKADSPPK